MLKLSKLNNEKQYGASKDKVFVWDDPLYKSPNLAPHSRAYHNLNTREAQVITTDVFLQIQFCHQVCVALWFLISH